MRPFFALCFPCTGCREVVNGAAGRVSGAGAKAPAVTAVGLGWRGGFFDLLPLLVSLWYFLFLGLKVPNSEYWLSLSWRVFLRGFFFFPPLIKGGKQQQKKRKQPTNKTKEGTVCKCFLDMN